MVVVVVNCFILEPSLAVWPVAGAVRVRWSTDMANARWIFWIWQSV